MDSSHLPVLAARVLCCALFALLFVQSAMEKLLDPKGSLEFLRGHFAKTPLGPLVPLLFWKLTLLMLVSGAACVGGVVQLLLGAGTALALAGLCASGLTLLALFFGQQVAKDSNGAGALVPYAVLCAVGLLSLR